MATRLITRDEAIARMGKAGEAAMAASETARDHLRQMAASLGYAASGDREATEEAVSDFMGALVALQEAGDQLRRASSAVASLSSGQVAV